MHQQGIRGNMANKVVEVAATRSEEAATALQMLSEKLDKAREGVRKMSEVVEKAKVMLEGSRVSDMRVDGVLVLEEMYEGCLFHVRSLPLSHLPHLRSNWSPTPLPRSSRRWMRSSQRETMTGGGGIGGSAGRLCARGGCTTSGCPMASRRQRWGAPSSSTGSPS